MHPWHFTAPSSNTSAHTKQVEAKLVSELEATCAALASAALQTAGSCVGARAESISARPIMAGNSVHNDWFLARRDLPEFTKRLHYRLMDASSFKSEWAAHLGGPGAGGLDKDDRDAVRAVFPAADIAAAAHDAYYDAQASLAELAWYRGRLAR